MSSSNPPLFGPHFAFFLLLISLMANLSQSDACDLFRGYNGSECPFITPPWNCINNGRLDKMYLKYKWQPSSCSLIRFDGKDFLKRLQGKKIMLIGDSLSWNMWQSLACLVHNGAPEVRYTMNQSELVSTISFTEFRVTIMYLQTWFLVDLVNETIGLVLKLDSLSLSGKWKGIDILVFNSYHWWQHMGDHRKRDYMQNCKLVKRHLRTWIQWWRSYNIALSSWAKWVDSTIDTTQTKVFFQGISAMLNSGQFWGDPSVIDCDGQTKPISGPSFLRPMYPGEKVIKCVLTKMKTYVYLLDITLLTQLRKDGHPSHWGNPTIDSSHWCLADVPDTWNQILNTILSKASS